MELVLHALLVKTNISTLFNIEVLLQNAPFLIYSWMQYFHFLKKSIYISYVKDNFTNN